MAKPVVPSGKIFDLLLKRISLRGAREMKKENSKLNLDTDAWYSYLLTAYNTIKHMHPFDSNGLCFPE